MLSRTRPSRGLLAPALLALASVVAFVLPLRQALAATAATNAAASTPGPAGDALQRPALAVRQPAQAVLLSVAQAGERLVAVGERGLITLSDDQGQRWRQVASPVSVTLTRVRFADAQQGVAIGHGGTVLSTTDGGQTWQRRLDGHQLAKTALQAAQASGDAARMREAEQLLADGPDKPLLDIALLSAQRWLVVGAYGIAMFTEDAGATWQSWMDRLPNPRGLHLYALRRQGASWLLAGEQGLLLRSDDDGASFRALASPYRGSWFAAEILPSGEWVLAGLRGNVWRSSDRGASWAPLAVPMPASVTGMAQTPATAAGGSRLLFVNQAGHVLQRQGERLAPLTRQPLAPLAGVAPLADGRLLAFGLAGVRLLDASEAAPR